MSGEQTTGGITKVLPETWGEVLARVTLKDGVHEDMVRGNRGFEMSLFCMQRVDEEGNFQKMYCYKVLTCASCRP